jgi:hypothetical protein
VEDTEGQGDHLHILGSSRGRDVAGLGTNIELNSALQPRDQEVGSLSNGGRLDSLNSVENNSAVTSLDYFFFGNEGEVPRLDDSSLYRLVSLKHS